MVDNEMNTDFIHADIDINGTVLDMIVDTGSKVSLINYDTYKSHFSDCHLLKSDLLTILTILK